MLKNYIRYTVLFFFIQFVLTGYIVFNYDNYVVTKADLESYYVVALFMFLSMFVGIISYLEFKRIEDDK